MGVEGEDPAGEERVERVLAGPEDQLGVVRRAHLVGLDGADLEAGLLHGLLELLGDLRVDLVAVLARRIDDGLDAGQLLLDLLDVVVDGPGVGDAVVVLVGAGRDLADRDAQDQRHQGDPRELGDPGGVVAGRDALHRLAVVDDHDLRSALGDAVRGHGVHGPEGIVLGRRDGGLGRLRWGRSRRGRDGDAGRRGHPAVRLGLLRALLLQAQASLQLADVPGAGALRGLAQGVPPSVRDSTDAPFRVSSMARGCKELEPVWGAAHTRDNAVRHGCCSACTSPVNGESHREVAGIGPTHLTCQHDSGSTGVPKLARLARRLQGKPTLPLVRPSRYAEKGTRRDPHSPRPRLAPGRRRRLPDRRDVGHRLGRRRPRPHRRPRRRPRAGRRALGRPRPGPRPLERQRPLGLPPAAGPLGPPAARADRRLDLGRRRLEPVPVLLPDLRLAPAAGPAVRVRAERLLPAGLPGPDPGRRGRAPARAAAVRHRRVRRRQQHRGQGRQQRRRACSAGSG